MPLAVRVFAAVPVACRINATPHIELVQDTVNMVLDCTFLDEKMIPDLSVAKQVAEPITRISGSFFSCSWLSPFIHNTEHKS